METRCKVAWVPIKNRKLLFARTRGQELFFSVGGKIHEGETKEEALIREVYEETTVKLLPSTISHFKTFEGPFHGLPDVTLQIICFSAEGAGELASSNEVEELAWLTSSDMEKTTVMGQMILRWFKEQKLID